MVARLGRVMYWAGCAFGMALLVLGIMGGIANHGADGWFYSIVCVVLAAIGWSIGRLCLYALGGE